MNIKPGITEISDISKINYYKIDNKIILYTGPSINTFTQYAFYKWTDVVEVPLYLIYQDTDMANQWLVSDLAVGAVLWKYENNNYVSYPFAISNVDIMDCGDEIQYYCEVVSTETSAVAGYFVSNLTKPGEKPEPAMVNNVSTGTKKWTEIKVKNWG